MGLFGSSEQKPEPTAPPVAAPTAADLRFEKAKTLAQQRIRAIVDKEFGGVATVSTARTAFAEIVRLADAVARLRKSDMREDEWPDYVFCAAPGEDERREEDDKNTTLIEDFENEVAPFFTLGMNGEVRAAVLAYLTDIYVLPAER